MDQQNTKQKGLSFLHKGGLTFLYITGIVMIVVLAQKFLVQPVLVSGSSMEKTLNDGDCLLVDKLTYHIKNPQRFDVIIFRPDQDEEELYYIKRIIGLPGETVQIKDNLIYINGTPLIENFGMENVIRYEGMAAQPVTLKDGEYFVLGDNRNDSKDSRDSAVGIVSSSAVWGRAFFRIWPVAEAGRID